MKNLLEINYIIERGYLEKIEINELEMEKISLLIDSKYSPNWIFVRGNKITLSSILGLIYKPFLSKMYPQNNRELTQEEKEIHQEFLESQEIKKRNNKLLGNINYEL